jgi:hypothetical protein
VTDVDDASGWQDEVRRQTHQDKEGLEVQKQKKAIAVHRVSDFWGKLLDANGSLPLDIRLNVGVDRGSPILSNRKNHVLRLVLEVPAIAEEGAGHYLGDQREFHIGYDADKSKLYGATKLMSRGSYYGQKSYDIQDSTAETIVKNLCKGDLIYEGLTKEARSGCFIATAAYGSPDCAEVVFLRSVRDEVLLPTGVGRLFTRMYYLLSPPLASLVRRSRSLRRVMRAVVMPPILRLGRCMLHKRGELR